MDPGTSLAVCSMHLLLGFLPWLSCEHRLMTCNLLKQDSSCLGLFFCSVTSESGHQLGTIQV